MRIWEVPEGLDVSKFNFDFDIELPLNAETYIYQFGTQWQRTGGPRLIEPDATDVKYIDSQRAIALSTREKPHWIVDPAVDESRFDFSWHPDDTSPPYIHVFGVHGHKAEDSHAVMYVQPGATEYKYHNSLRGRLRRDLPTSEPQDVIFISNGETCAEENWQHLQTVMKGKPNRLIRSDGVNGRVQAYHRALELSNTPWAFCVFAKLKVNPDFDWNFRPIFKRHYVFTATNPVNGLEYGHQAMIAYNRELTLANQGQGLDFTMDDPFTVIYSNSGTATYNTTPYETWKTAFRECIKLKRSTDTDSQHRLLQWLENSGIGFGEDSPFGQYSRQGAQDAVDYYLQVAGDFDKLKLTYEWSWLKDYYEKLSKNH